MLIGIVRHGDDEEICFDSLLISCQRVLLDNG